MRDMVETATSGHGDGSDLCSLQLPLSYKRYDSWSCAGVSLVPADRAVTHAQGGGAAGRLRLRFPYEKPRDRRRVRGEREHALRC